MNKKETSYEYWQEQSDKFAGYYGQAKKGFWRKFVHNFLDSRFKIISGLISKGINRDSVVVDIGCGSGIYLTYLARFRPKQIIGLDYSQQMIEIAREKLKGIIQANQKISLIKGKAEKLDLPEHCANLVLAIGLFDYLTNPQQVLSEMDRILKPDGRIIITLPKKYSPLFFLRHWPGLYLRKHLLKLPPIINSWSKKGAIKFFSQFNLIPQEIKQVQKTMWIFELRKQI
jgi:ubiquinone/menaquinone biosynthesis C-methylase UbiE